MATRIFPWGTVRSTPNGVSLSFARGVRFDLSIYNADSVIRHIKNTQVSLLYTMCSLNCTGLFIRLEWNWRSPTSKSVLKVGHGNCNGVWESGTTPTLLNYDEAMELADAICATQPVMAPAGP